jgi:hypothetical protein
MALGTHVPGRERKCTGPLSESRYSITPSRPLWLPMYQ